jgi:hypothetical protein
MRDIFKSCYVNSSIQRVKYIKTNLRGQIRDELVVALWKEFVGELNRRKEGVERRGGDNWDKKSI